MKSTFSRSELDSLLALSARVGRDRSLTQASNGNTSIKLGRALWIKASGKWLANALHENVLVPVDLMLAKDCLRRNHDIASMPVHPSANGLKPSIESSMHVALPHRIIAHLHSVNAIAHAIRSDALQQLQWRLDGLRWEWMPYVASGLPLAQAIERAVKNSPYADVFVLGNHGLIVCGNNCDAVQKLLDEVEARLTIKPRQAPGFDSEFLLKLTSGSGWRLPQHTALHALATDRIAREIFSGGVLYPCQAIFLGGRSQPFAILENKGLLISDTITRAELETLLGLVAVIQRVDDPSRVCYLTETESKAASSLSSYRARSAGFDRPAMSA